MHINTRLLQTANSTNTTDDKVNSTATAGLLISGLVTVIAIFAFVMMANIQTPQSFAKKDLIKGKINK